MKFPFVEANLDTWLLAASHYHELRTKGITMPLVDVTIAAIAILNDIPLFSRDAHFVEVAQVSGLRLYGG